MAKLLRWLQWQIVPFIEQPSVDQCPFPSSPVSKKAHIRSSRGRFVDLAYGQIGDEGVQNILKVWG
ncbi:hypothetical protein I79_008390 [Cricetulus griseus]|uniref:Uncharacterized protein n=1 Tax=Cricetulus griseus TaxID=10029 RepID=G3HD17_CRIGR|nr:hypothetical protein I79_008390 [Cricetulus griseus]